MDFTGAVAAGTVGLPHVCGVHIYTHIHTELANRGICFPQTVFIYHYPFVIYVTIELDMLAYLPRTGTLLKASSSLNIFLSHLTP